MDELLAMVKWFASPFDPEGYVTCDGRLMQIMQNQALYSLLGNTHGGDGRTTFALPDMRPEETTYEIVEVDGKPTVKVTKTKRAFHPGEVRPMICVQGLYPQRQY